MDDLGLNQWLVNTYGTTVDNKPLFRLIWSTGVTEKREGIFQDFYGDILIREVREVREVLKYPFAQDRWVLERIKQVTQPMREFGLLDEAFTYSEIYIFQDRSGHFLPLTREMCEAAMYLFFKYFVQMTWKERTDFRIKQLAQKELDKRQKYLEAIGDGQAAHSVVIE